MWGGGGAWICAFRGKEGPEAPLPNSPLCENIRKVRKSALSKSSICWYLDLGLSVLLPSVLMSGVCVCVRVCVLIKIKSYAIFYG